MQPRQRWALVVGALVVAAMLAGCARPDPARPSSPSLTRSVSAGRISLVEPPIEPDVVIDQNDPAVSHWMRRGGRDHVVRGHAAADALGTALRVRPWLYTTCWLPQPTVAVEADGSFEAVVSFAPNYDQPLVICIEVEEADGHRVLGSFTYFLKALGAAGERGASHD